MGSKYDPDFHRLRLILVTYLETKLKKSLKQFKLLFKQFKQFSCYYSKFNKQ